MDNLPPACPLCAPYEGAHRLIERPDGAVSLGRCKCPRGLALRALDQRPPVPAEAPPIISAESAMAAVTSLAALPGFPFEAAARSIIADEIMSLCQTVEEPFILVKHMLRYYSRWPSVREMRILYCTLIGIPRSGIELYTAVSAFYPDGFPPPVPQPQRPLPALPLGHVVTADKELDQAVVDAAKLKSLNPPPLCTKCQDHGYLVQPGRIYVWCDCAVGIDRQAKMPEFLVALNREPLK